MTESSKTTLDVATKEQLEAELAARRVAEVEEATAPAKAEAEAHIADSCPKVAAAGISMGTERTDEQYVTIDLPDPLPANWGLIRKAMAADPALTVAGAAVTPPGTMRVRQDRVGAVLDFIEANLP